MTLLDEPSFISDSGMPPDDVRALSRLTFARNGDLQPGDRSGEAPIGTISMVGITAMVFLLSLAAPVAHDPLNFATFSVYKRTAGGAPQLVAQLTTAATDLPASIRVAIPLQGTPTFAFDDDLSLAISKSGAGVVVPAGKLYASFSPDIVTTILDEFSSLILDRLRKRYDTDAIAANPPNSVKRWLRALVTRELFITRGFNPSAEQDATINGRADAALADIREAADAKDGLFELPLREGVDASAVSRGGPLAYTETSPFVSADRQERQGRCEDAVGTGTYGGGG